MDTLLESLKVEILHRLPLQSLALCKCISKHWLTLITSTPRVFMARHHNELPLTLLFQYPYKQRVAIDTSFAATICPPPCSKFPDLNICPSSSDNVSFSHITDNFSMTSHTTSHSQPKQRGELKKLHRANTTFHCPSRVGEPPLGQRNFLACVLIFYPPLYY